MMGMIGRRVRARRRCRIWVLRKVLNPLSPIG